MISNIDSLKPNNYRIELTIKVVELIASLKATHDDSGNLISVNEYLIGDESGCLILSTSLALEKDGIYKISKAHTGTVEGYLRLYSNQIHRLRTTVIDAVNIRNNRSTVYLEKRLF